MIEFGEWRVQEGVSAKSTSARSGIVIPRSQHSVHTVDDFDIDLASLGLDATGEARTVCGR